MEVIIILLVSVIGTRFYSIDFCTLFTFVSIAISIYKSTTDFTKIPNGRLIYKRRNKAKP